MRVLVLGGGFIASHLVDALIADPVAIIRARALLGYEPRVGLADGACELVGWVGRQMADDRVDQAVKQLESRGLLH